MRPRWTRPAAVPLLIAVGLAVVIVIFRTVVSGWAPPAVPLGGNSVYGLAAYPADNLSYISWAAQAGDGRWLFEILYTTTEHGRLFFNPLFLAVGWTAAALGTSPILILNVVSVFSLPIVVLSFWSICRRVGLSAPAALAATALALGGGGISWVRALILEAGLGGVVPVAAPGPDQYFYDVYPIVAYFVAPYHALALALVAALIAAIVALDDSAEPIGRARLAGMGALALALASVRPHIGIMVCLAFGATTAVTLLARSHRPLFRRRALLAATLGTATLPPVLYSLWVSRQPVWAEYARAHPVEFNEWAVGFLALWVLAGAGIGIVGRRLVTSRFAFPAAWSVAAAMLLVGLNGFIYPKLTYGVTLMLAVLAGAAIEAGLQQVRSRAGAAAVVAGVVCIAFASPLNMLRQYTPKGAPKAAPELFRSIEAIQRATPDRLPTVLTDCGTGVLLPALGRARVFCGHWALTDYNREKIVLLSRLGFMAADASVPTFPDLDAQQMAASQAALRAQVRDGTFDYLLVRTRFALYEHVAAAASGCALQTGSDYAVLRMCPPLKARLEQLLATADVE